LVSKVLAAHRLVSAAMSAKTLKKRYMHGLDMHLQEHKWEKARYLLDKMKRDPKVTLDAEVYLAILVGLSSAGPAELALEVFQEAKGSAEIKLSPKFYASAISACAREGLADKALGLLEEAKGSHLQNMRVYSAVVSACACAGEWQTALEVFDECRQTYDGKPSLDLYNAALRACALGDSPERALHIFHEVQADDRLSANQDTYRHTIKALERTGRHVEARALCDDMDRSACQTDTAEGMIWERVPPKLQWCKKIGDWKQALQILHSDDAATQEHSKDGMFLCAIEACAKARQVDKCLQLFYEMRAHPDHVPCVTTSCHNILIGLCKRGIVRWDEIAEIFEQTEEDLKFGITSCGILINFYKNCGWWRKCLELLRHVKASPDMSPSNVMYQHTIAACLAGGEVKEALQLTDEAARRGLVLNPKMCETLATLASEMADVAMHEDVAQPNAAVGRALLRLRMENFAPDLVNILQVARADRACFKTALQESPALQQCRGALQAEGHSPDVHGGAQIFVQPSKYEAVMRALMPFKSELRFYHIVTEPSLEQHVRAAIRTLPSREQVRVRDLVSLYSVPVFSADHGVLVTVKDTFISMKVPPSSCSQVSSSSAAAHSSPPGL